MFHHIDILNFRIRNSNVQAFYVGTDILVHIEIDLRLLLFLHRVSFLTHVFPLLAMEIAGRV